MDFNSGRRAANCFDAMSKLLMAVCVGAEVAFQSVNSIALIRPLMEGGVSNSRLARLASPFILMSDAMRRLSTACTCPVTSSCSNCVLMMADLIYFILFTSSPRYESAAAVALLSSLTFLQNASSALTSGAGSDAALRDLMTNG